MASSLGDVPAAHGREDIGHQRPEGFRWLGCQDGNWQEGLERGEDVWFVNVFVEGRDVGRYYYSSFGEVRPDVGVEVAVVQSDDVSRFVS